jgi:glycosyltransferase involved in cell wall biosynthesis
LADRLLFLSYAFPPMAAPEGVVSAKRMGALPGFEVDVVCAQTRPEWFREDRTLDEYVGARFGTVERVRRGPLWDRLSLRSFGGVLRPPDEFRLLNRPTRHIAERMLRERDYVAVVSASQSHAVHLVGLALKRNHGLPWIAHFSDPWTRNPFVRLEGLERRINERLERRVLAAADRLVFTSETAADLCLAGFPPAYRAKAHALPHPFDPLLYPPSRVRVGGDRILLRYVGAFYGRRTPRPLVDALARFEPDLLARVRVEIVGEVAPGLLDTSTILPEGTITVVPPVDYVPSLRAMTEADGLLVVDAPAASSPFLPSKLVDYVGAGRPVAALTPPGPAADLTRRLGGPVADPADAEACAEALRQLVDLAVTHADATFGAEDVRREVSVEAVRGRMAGIVRELL